MPKWDVPPLGATTAVVGRHYVTRAGTRRWRLARGTRGSVASTRSALLIVGARTGALTVVDLTLP